MGRKTQNEIRRNLIGFIIYAVVATVLVIALSFASPTNAEQENFGPIDNGKVVEVKLGTIITVGLPENPSTGYSWSYNIDNKVAEVIEDCFVPPENSIPGAGGTRLLSLRIIGSGELSMSYERSWEKQPIDSFTLVFDLI
jgi:predicted secreted protein